MPNHAKSLQSCPTLCDPVDCSPPGFFLEWVAVPSSRGSSWPRDRTCISYISCIASGYFTTSTTWESPLMAHISLISSFPILVLLFFSSLSSESRDANKMLNRSDVNGNLVLYLISKRKFAIFFPLNIMLSVVYCRHYLSDDGFSLLFLLC